MSSHYDITMSLNDTLELDTIIKESSSAVSPISGVKHIGDDSDHKSGLKGIQTSTAIFDPPKSGEYEIYINGQTLSINVKDTNAIPGSAVHYLVAEDYDSANNEWVAEIGPNLQDFSGNPTLGTSTFNSVDKSVIQYRGDSSKVASGTGPYPLSNNYALIYTAKQQEIASITQFYFDSDTNVSHSDDDGTNHRIKCGDIDSQTGTPEISAEVFAFERDGDTANLYKTDTSNPIISSTGSNLDGLNGFVLAELFGSGNSLDVDFLELMVLDSHTQNELENEMVRQKELINL